MISSIDISTHEHWVQIQDPQRDNIVSKTSTTNLGVTTQKRGHVPF